MIRISSLCPTCSTAKPWPQGRPIFMHAQFNMSQICSTPPAWLCSGIPELVALLVFLYTAPKNGSLKYAGTWVWVKIKPPRGHRFSPRLHLPGLHFGVTLFSTHCHISQSPGYLSSATRRARPQRQRGRRRHQRRSLL